MDRPLALRLLSPDRKIVLSFTTKYAFPRQLKDRVLELSIRKSKASFVLSLFFVSSEEKDCYRVVSVGQLGLTAARTAGTATVVFSKLFFAVLF